MDLSWAAVVFIPTIITPAIILYFMFRLLIPKAKSAPNNDFVTILIFILLSALINLQLIGYFTEVLWKAHIPQDKSIVLKLFKDVLGRNDYDPIRPFIFLYKRIVNDFLPTNVFGVLIDLHFRVFLVGGIIYLSQVGFKLLKWIVDDKFYGRLPSELLYKINNAISNPFKKYFFSYWNYVLDFDENLEILMVDITTDGDELFSGKFTDWTPDDDTSRDAIGSLGITTILKYEARGTSKEEFDEEEEEKKKAQKSHFYMQSSRRRWRLIQNDGAMYIPYSTIKSIHVWRIQRGSSLNVWVNDKNKNARLKWHLMLASKHPKFIKEVRVNVEVKNQKEADNYLENLFSWIAENEVDNVDDKLSIEFFSKKEISFTNSDT